MLVGQIVHEILVIWLPIIDILHACCQHGTATNGLLILNSKYHFYVHDWNKIFDNNMLWVFFFFGIFSEFLFSFHNKAAILVLDYLLAL